MPFNPASLRNLRQNTGRATVRADKKSGKNRSVPTVAAPDSVSVNQLVAEEIPRTAQDILKMSAPAAAELLAKIVNGALRAPPHVRAATAIKVLESQGLMGQQSQQSGQQPDDSRVLAVLAALEKAMEHRRRAQGASDAKLIHPT